MSDEVNKTTNEPAGPVPPKPPVPERRRSHWTRSAVVGGALALVIVSAGAGAFAMRVMHHGQNEMMPLKPTAVNALSDDSIAAIQGSVAEIFGNKFVIADQTGRALVDTGPEGRDGLVKLGETVTAQGRFDDGSLHAGMLVRADGKVETLRMGPGRGPGGKHGWDRDGGPRDERRGPDGGPDAPPPPPAPQ